MTNKPAYTWHFFEYGSFDDEPVFSCYLGKVFYFWRGRKGERSKEHFDEDAFPSSMNLAKERIERLREQGSGWVIEELPVLVLAGNRSALSIPRYC